MKIKYTNILAVGTLNVFIACGETDSSSDNSDTNPIVGTTKKN